MSRTATNKVHIVSPEIESKALPMFLKEASGELTEDMKIDNIRYHFECIMKTLGLDLSDRGLRGTPERVARMYVKEIFSGLNSENYPKISVFENAYGYDQMLIEKDITFYSHCEHHFTPILGKAHVAYFPGTKVIGLSKINRLVRYFSRRPQVQERLTVEIANALKTALQTNDIAVFIEADHLCVSSRGVSDTASATVTSHFDGKFLVAQYREEFLQKLRP